MSSEPTSPPHPMSSGPLFAVPVRRVAIVLYGTLALVWLAIPAPVSDWCDEAVEKGAPPIVATVAHGVEDVSKALHIADVYAYTRTAFRSLIER